MTSASFLHGCLVCVSATRGFARVGSRENAREGSSVALGRCPSLFQFVDEIVHAEFLGVLRLVPHLL